MNPLESFALALRALTANKLRSSLTVLGIIIGVSAVIALMSIGRGTQSMITSQISGMGTNLLFVRPGRAVTERVSGAAGSAASLTLEDAQAIADPSNTPSVAAVAPEVSSFGQIVAGSINTNSRVTGVTPEYEEVRNTHVANGAFVTKQEVDARSRVAVLGVTVAQTLFSDTDPVGQSIRINNQQFKVIGVLEKKGGTGMGSQDDVVLMPITTVMYRMMAQRTARGGLNISTINVQVADEKLMDNAVQEISTLLRQRHRLLTGEDDFTVQSQEDLLQTVNQVTGVMTLFLGAIAGISLVVGGIGIMNIMLVSVTERTREIGIRKAVGAKRRDILVQFLIEATTLSLAGGGMGLLLGWAISRAIAQVDISGQRLTTTISPDIVILAVAVSAAIGVFFGIYPASRAARLHPIEALRYE